MTTDRELMRRTWEFFSHYMLVNEMAQESLDAEAKTILEALRARLAQPEQEPVAWWHDIGDVVDLNVSGRGIPLYTAPPQREWQGLTDEDIEQIHYGIKCKGIGAYSTNDIYRAIEAKLKEKNT